MRSLGRAEGPVGQEVRGEQRCLPCPRGPTLLSRLRHGAGWLCLVGWTGSPSTDRLRSDDILGGRGNGPPYLLFITGRAFCASSAKTTKLCLM